MIRKNNYIKNMRSRAIKTINENIQLEGEKLKLEQLAKEQKITRLVANEKIKEINDQMNVSIDETIKGINELCQSYIEKIDIWNMPSGDKVHEDIKLLQGGYPMSKEELQTLGLKHKDNQVMQKIFKKYSEENDFYYTTSVTAEDKYRSIKVIADAVNAAIKNPGGYSGVILLNDTHWDNYLDNYNVALGDGWEMSNNII